MREEFPLEAKHASVHRVVVPRLPDNGGRLKPTGVLGHEQEPMHQRPVGLERRMHEMQRARCRLRLEKPDPCFEVARDEV